MRYASPEFWIMLCEGEFSVLFLLFQGEKGSKYPILAVKETEINQALTVPWGGGDEKKQVVSY